MRTETYNTLRQNSVDAIAWNNARLSTWSSDPVGIGTTLTAGFSRHTNETVEFLKHATAFPLESILTSLQNWMN